jgi:outer membrane protein assembly factor BamB
MRTIAWSVAIGFVFLGFGAVSAGDRWPEFRGPTGQGHSASKGFPTKWSPTENVTWKIELPGKGWSSPIIDNGRIYLTSAVPLNGEDDDQHSLRTVALDAASGKVVWDVEVFRQPIPRIHTKNSHASPTPITDGQHLFVHFGTQGTACLNLDGKIVWKNNTLNYSPVHGSGGSPVLVDDKLIVSCDGGEVQFITALDRATGMIVWKTPRETQPVKGFSFGTPLVIEVNGKRQVVSQGSELVAAYDPATGREIWRVVTGGYSVVPRPVFGHEMVFACTGYDQPQLLAIRPDGKGDVTETHVAWKLDKAVPHNPSPLLVGDDLYIVSDRGIATCLDAKSGDQRWQQRLGGNYSSSPVFADGYIFLQSEEGETFVLVPGPTYVEVARNNLKERTLASFALADGSLFIRTEQRLYRFDTTR